MDAESRQNAARLLRFSTEKPVSVFTDLDKTSCVEGCREYAAENESETGKKGCFMQPDIRRALTSLPESGSAYYIVTGRHWKDARVDDVTGEKIPDGAFYDLLGGVNAFEKAAAVAGHGRLLVKDGKTTVLSRSANDAFKEQKFERYIGENVLKLKQEIFKRWPEARGHILAEYKKHLSYVNVAEYAEINPEAGKEMAAFVDKEMRAMMTAKDAPENPNNALFYTVEPTGSMEVRSRNQSKRNGVEKSGFLEQAYKQGGAVLVMGDSFGKNGTDRDMVEAVRDYFTAKGAQDRVFVIHVLNGEQNRLTDKTDSCFPTIAVKDPNELGQLMKLVAGQSKTRARTETVLKQTLANKRGR